MKVIDFNIFFVLQGFKNKLTNLLDSFLWWVVYIKTVLENIFEQNVEVRLNFSHRIVG